MLTGAELGRVLPFPSRWSDQPKLSEHDVATYNVPVHYIIIYH